MMKAGLLQLPLICFPPPGLLLPKYLEKQNLCVCAMQPSHGRDSDSQWLRWPAGSTWLGTAHRDGLEGRQGAATWHRLCPRTCGHCLGDLANPFPPCTSEEPCQWDRQLASGLTLQVTRQRWPDGRHLAQAPGEATTQWTLGPKVPPPLLGEFFPFRSGKLVFNGKC